MEILVFQYHTEDSSEYPMLWEVFIDKNNVYCDVEVFYDDKNGASEYFYEGKTFGPVAEEIREEHGDEMADTILEFWNTQKQEIHVINRIADYLGGKLD